jgi:hypothetical protein
VPAVLTPQYQVHKVLLVFKVLQVLALLEPKVYQDQMVQQA